MQTLPAYKTATVKINVNVFVGATVFLYFDSNISELQQSSVREHLRFQGATISEFYHKKVNIVLLNRSATKKQKKGLILKTSSSRGALMLRKSQDKNKKIGDCKNVFQRAKLDGIKVMY